MLRINKYLSSLGIASRRHVDNLILLKKISINGKIANLGQKIDPINDQIYLNGKKISGSIQKSFIYLLLNKPPGIVTTTKDEQGRPTVLDLVKTPVRVVPVGRLDQYTSGLLLLSNDGELTYRLTHPRFHISKTYLVTFSGVIKTSQIRELQKGVMLADGPTLPAQINNLKGNSFEITITQGKNRQIRRMCQKVGIQLAQLHRLSIGPITLKDLPEGSSRNLSPEEVKKLKQFASLQ